MSTNKIPPKGATLTPERKPPIRLAWLKKMRLPPYLVTASLLSVVAVLIALGAQEIAQRWKINQIDIVGRLNVVKAEQLVGQLVWVKNESFFELDVRQVREQISGLPMLESVAIRKRWPNILEIQAQEGVPVAVWNGDQILTASGRLISLDKEEALDGLGDGLMKLNGDQSACDLAIRMYRRTQQTLDGMRVSIDSMSVNGVGAVKISLDNGWLVNLGRNRVEQRLDRLVLLLKTLNQPEVAGVDFRYGNAAAVSWNTMGDAG